MFDAQELREGSESRGALVRGESKLETCKNTSIRVAFDAGRSRGHGDTITPWLGPVMDRMGSECIGFDAREPRGLTEVASSRNDPARAEGDDDPSSGW